MRFIKAVVEYDGTDFYGFQVQKDVPTIQGELERALAEITGYNVEIIGSGRTDAGVHASGQVISFCFSGTIPVEKICYALNSKLPKSIALLTAVEVDERFHARFSAKSRTYRYTILNREMPSPLFARYSWHIRKRLNDEAMNRASKSLIGVHDFKSFCSGLDNSVDTTREVYLSQVTRQGDLVYYEINANAFLRSMVRGIVGTLVEIGLGDRDVGDIAKILKSSNRSQAGKTAPPQGLNLIEVEY